MLACTLSLILALTAPQDRGTIRPQAAGLAAQYRKSHALLIGINTYPKLADGRNLAYAVADIEAVAKVLTESYGFAPADVKLLKDSEATLVGIRKALAALADPAKVGPDDRVIIYFAGHGQSVPLPGGGSEGYLLPEDAELSEQPTPAEYIASCLPMQQVWQMLRACPAKHVLVVADSCFSGFLSSDRSGASGESLKSLLERPARQVIAGSSNTETSRERADLGHGVFTYKFVEELRARAKDLEFAFTTTELYASVAKGVRQVTDGRQTPQLGSFETQGEMVFVPTPASEDEELLSTKMMSGVAVALPGAKLFASRQHPEIDAERYKEFVRLLKLDGGEPAQLEKPLALAEGETLTVVGYIPGEKLYEVKWGPKLGYMKADSIRIESSTVSSPTGLPKWLEKAFDYVGTPYVWGGENLQTGIDAVGFVRQMFKARGISLPKTLLDQEKVGKVVHWKEERISRGGQFTEMPMIECSLLDLRPGDRIIFQRETTSTKPEDRTVAIYVGHVPEALQARFGNIPYAMILATSSRGVTITSLTQKYYWNIYKYALRDIPKP
jgi:hypothetical protein